MSSSNTNTVNNLNSANTSTTTPSAPQPANSPFRFIALLGATSEWTFQALQSFVPSPTMWGLHTENSYLSYLATNQIVQNDGSILVPFSGQYLLRFSLQVTKFGGFEGALKAWIKYVPLVNTNSFANAQICNTTLIGADLNLKETSCVITLAKGDLLYPTFLPSDNNSFDFGSNICICNTLSLGYLGRDRPSATYSNLILPPNSNSTNLIIASSFTRAKLPHEYKIVYTVPSTLGSIVQSNITVYLTSDSTQNGPALFQEMMGIPLISVFHPTLLVAQPTISYFDTGKVTITGVFPAQTIVQFVVTGINV